jgi:hypothetical protein
LLDPNGVAILWLTPEITNDGRGVDGLLTLIKTTGFNVIDFPEIGEDNSQLIKIKLSRISLRRLIWRIKQINSITRITCTIISS